MKIVPIKVKLLQLLVVSVPDSQNVNCEVRPFCRFLIPLQRNCELTVYQVSGVIRLCRIAPDTTENGEYIFSPSKFTGYKNNTKAFLEMNHTDGNGGETNVVISEILDHNCEFDKNIDNRYKDFCKKNDIIPSKKEKRYWEL